MWWASVAALRWSPSPTGWRHPMGGAARTESMTAALAVSRRAAIALCWDMRRTLAAGAVPLERIHSARDHLRATCSRHGDGPRVDICAQEFAAVTQCGYRRRPAAGEGITHHVPRLTAGYEHAFEELHWFLRGIRGLAQSRHGPHIVQVPACQFAPAFAGKHDLLMAAAEVVAHAEVHLVPYDHALHVEELAHKGTQREQREAVEHDVDVPIVAQDAAAFREEPAIRARVIRELGEPPRVVGTAVVADDASMSESHVLVHAGVRRIRDDDVDRVVGETFEETDAVGGLDVERRRSIRAR